VCIRQFVCDTHSKKRKPTNERSPHRTRLTATPRPGGGSASLRRRRRGIGIRERERSGMAGDRMSWARLLKWSLSYMDGARPSRDIRWGEGKWRLVISSAVFIWVAAEASLWCAVLCSEEERRWLAEAVERHMAEDVVGRLREIALLMRTPLSVLEAQGITPEDIEDLLAELQVHVESIDIANGMSDHCYMSTAMQTTNSHTTHT
uniref:Nucleotide exchange factor Fes1 domain-containing protein n=1 Tax=Aegilops tauschii subsp. strangulata TaxID=200361 RepID=A0A453IE26_AEGTS